MPNKGRKVRRVKSTSKESPREVCILGYAQETRELVFTLDDAVEIWGINMAHEFLKERKKTGHRWYQLHPRDWALSDNEPTGYWGRPKRHLDFLQEFEGPVFMSYQDPDVPKCEIFPLEKMHKHFPRLYFTSTFSYIIAHVLYEHNQGKPVKKLYLYGINLTALDEYTQQRPCVEYWIGKCEEAGIEVVLPSASALCKGRLYAFGHKEGEDDLATHTLERLQYWKDQYIMHWTNIMVIQAMHKELEHWTGFLGQVFEAGQAEVEEFAEGFEGEKEEAATFAKELADKIHTVIQERINKRESNNKSILVKEQTSLSSAQGVVRTEQHYLSLNGGVDHRAPALPELRFPAEFLSEDYETPTKSEAI